MDWVRLISDRSRISGLLRTDRLATEFGYSETVVANALRRQQRRGLVDHLGKKIFINRLTADFSGRELVNEVRPEAYLSLETVLRDSGVSSQTPKSLTCVTPARPGEFKASTLQISFRRVSRSLFWGFQPKQTRYGSYNAAEPEKALLDWIYLLRQQGSPVPTDELDLHRLDRRKLLDYAQRFPAPVRQQVVELLALHSL